MGEFKFAIPRFGTAQLKKRSTFSIHFYNAGAPTFGGLSHPSTPANYTYGCGDYDYGKNCLSEVKAEISKRRHTYYSEVKRIKTVYTHLKEG